MSITFAQPTAEIPRDRWGRPLIVPADGGTPIPYTRVSTLAKALDDKTALTDWKCRQVALGMARRPDLVAKAASIPADDKRNMNEVVKNAMTAAEAERAANIGTALHSLTELVDAGQPVDAQPEFARADLAAYKAAMAGIEILAAEMFVVTDELQAAGTFDRLVRLHDGRVVVADVKTGQHDPTYPHGVAQQIAIYSRGHLYDPERQRIGHLPALGIDQSTGLLIWMPAGSGTCRLFELDLTVGWGLAQVSVAVRAAFKQKPITPYTP